MAGIILGDYTVSSGWFNAEIMLYMAFVAVANYTQVSLELGYALKFMRIILICLTAAFGPWGLLAGTALVVVLIVTNRTISGKSYIYPIVPFNGKQFLRRFFRVNLPSSEKETALYHDITWNGDNSMIPIPFNIVDIGTIVF